LEKASQKRVEIVMKNAFRKASLIENESQAVKKTISKLGHVGEQGVMYVPPLAVEHAFGVSVATTPTEKNVPYATVSIGKPSEHKRKSERLVEVETHKSKRVKQLATRPGRSKKSLLTIDNSSEEEQTEQEEKHEARQPKKASALKQLAVKTRQPWKPKIEKINTTIVDEGNFVQMNKFYDLYNDIENLKIDISTVRYMIKNNVRFDGIKSIVNKKVYDRLIAKKASIHKEDMELQKSMIKTLCKTEDEEEIKNLMSSLAPYLRNKMRPILFMGGDKDTIRGETITTINKMMRKLKKTP
jgi:hypothetical protein